MFITNWLAVGSENSGLVFPDQFASVPTRIYGNVFGCQDFQDGEYVKTGVIKSYVSGLEVAVTTVGGELFYLKNGEDELYKKYLKARYSRVITVLKYWKVVDGLIVGKTLDGKDIAGKIISQNLNDNICKFDDGRQVFVDWLSKDAEYIPERGNYEFLVFGIERCMPDVFGKHFRMFKKSYF